jgi:hypothetical protein
MTPKYLVISLGIIFAGCLIGFSKLLTQADMFSRFLGNHGSIKIADHGLNKEYFAVFYKICVTTSSDVFFLQDC